MLEVKVDSKSLVCSIEATGTTSDIMVEICMVVNSLYSTMHKQDRLMAEIFRQDLRKVFSNPKSPLWELDAIHGSGLVMTVPIKREDENDG